MAEELRIDFLNTRVVLWVAVVVRMVEVAVREPHSDGSRAVEEAEELLGGTGKHGC